MNEELFEKYVKWVENHKDEETGEYKKPRTTIYKNGRRLLKKEMSKEEYEEYSIGNMWRRLYETKIIKKYQSTNIEEIPGIYKEMVEKCRKLGIGTYANNKSKFEEYIEWVNEHQNNQTKEYIQPKCHITKKGGVKSAKEMTEEEKRETRLAQWWYLNPSERRVLERYQDVSEKEFLKLPEDIQKILIICNKYGLTPECTILKQIRTYVKDNVGTNSEIRSELARKVLEFDREEEK